MKIQLPKILNIPPKLLPIITQFNKYRYFLIEGGRGSGKSQSVARLISYVADKRNARIVCGREFQTNIKESVHALFSDLTKEHNLNFDVMATEIRHRASESKINFRGFRDQGKVNIKGLEGVDILFIDEAQSITAQTLKVLIPTIRKEKAKVFFVMNRYLDNDPVFLEFAEREDCLHIHIDYFENPHCPETSKKEAELCKSKNLDDYTHIWLGRPLSQATNAAFRGVPAIIDYDLDHPIPPDPAFQYVMGADLAKSVDHTAITILCIQKKAVHYFEQIENENKTSWNYQKEKILGLSRLYNDALIVTDSTGVGDPITEDLQRMGGNVFVDTTGDLNDKQVAGFKFTSISKENIIEKLKVAIELTMIKIPFVKVLVNELTKFEANLMPGGKVKYSAPSGKDELGNDIYHDDCVMALALALWGAKDMMYHPDYKAPAEVTQEKLFWSRVSKDLREKEIEKSDRQGTGEYASSSIQDDEIFISEN